jgi:MFS family permease
LYWSVIVDEVDDYRTTEESVMTSLEPRHRLLLPVILAAMFMYGFDLNVVNVAIPSLQHELHAGQIAIELVVGGYAFTYAAGLVTGGRLGDLFSHRRMFLIGMAAFTGASVLCGLAQTPGQLVAARLLQGLTAAMMMPQILALIMGSFTTQERPKALAWFGVTAACCTAAAGTSESRRLPLRLP